MFYRNAHCTEDFIGMVYDYLFSSLSTLKSVGEKYGRSPERVRQIISKFFRTSNSGKNIIIWDSFPMDRWSSYGNLREMRKLINTYQYRDVSEKLKEYMLFTLNEYKKRK